MVHLINGNQQAIAFGAAPKCLPLSDNAYIHAYRSQRMFICCINVIHMLYLSHVKLELGYDYDYC
ncbi:Ribosomal protein L7 [Mycoavidus cysteinexigens]|uniref:Ribosomal protein L7 n=1 Tax=Mycoavidus cysteinexigens TaxID=1553431 RepID=A0A2Z6EY98_9BURK|nr:Ribosomal protein L7 [Mycoavidus cysteinexigens]GLR00447.1 hypothetical protein GCM10007934_02580 [Mycoavidus cysteinexigens]